MTLSKNTYDDIIANLKDVEYLLIDAEIPQAANIIIDTIALIEHVKNEHVKWRCKVGDETFTTTLEEVANNWIETGYDVEKFFV